MSGFSNPFLGLEQFYGTQPTPPIQIQPSYTEKKMRSNESIHPSEIINEDDEDTVDLKYIIENRPKTKVVREFMKYNMNLIKSEEDIMFE